MRKFLVVLAVFLSLLIVHKADAAPMVMLDHKYLKFDTLPRIEEGRVLVPLRAIFESLGATVEWNEATKTVVSKKGDTQVQLVIGQKKAVKNGQEVILDVPSTVVESRTLVPLRFVSEAFGAQVEWNEARQTVIIDSRGTKLTTEQVAKYGDSVVSVISGGGEESIKGSGVILSSDGYIITNAHVLGEYKFGNVVLWDGREYPFEILRVDADYDLAMLGINATGLPYAVIGDSDKLNVGQDVIAIGNPLDFKNTVSTGILSGVRSIDGYNLLQVSTPISFGSSGGALFDSYGKLIGITTMGYLIGDLNFAIPINDVAKWIVANNTGKSIGIPLSIFQQGIGTYFGLSATASVKFSDIEDPYQSDFKSKISKSSEKIIFFLDLSYIKPNRLVFFKVDATYYAKQGDSYRQFYWETFYSIVKPHWEGSYISGKVPKIWDVNGYAIPGNYKIVYHIDNVKVAEGEFEVY